MPSVEAMGVVSDRVSADGEELEAVLITRYLEFSLPYRVILGRRVLPATGAGDTCSARRACSFASTSPGFFWGDCSLSNALFRRDAGTLSAYLVDAETGELHERLSDGQRQHDLEIAEENIVGELHDLAAELEREVVDDPFDVRRDVRESLRAALGELTADEVFAVARKATGWRSGSAA